ncbi:hypothetical protein COY29_00275, partial [Candidatus Woesebacteria bacterium CG_4_10_14_0_2_um_filter_39_14]
MKSSADMITPDYLRNKLKLKNLEVRQSFSEKFPEVNRFLTEKGIDLGKIREHSAKIIGAGALTGTLLFAPPGNVKSLPPLSEIISSIKSLTEDTGSDLPQKFLIDLLKGILPERARPLTQGEEKKLEQVFEKVIGVKTKADLEGEHLNTTYGYIGAEQHLARYPGDNIYNHPKIPSGDEGIAPGLGAWGYFSQSRENLTKSLEETEKWYAVVQTLYLPDWNKRAKYLREWYKYRKVLVVNTDNGNAVVAAIADSGPAAWTGRH